MTKTSVDVATLNALLDVVTTPRRFENRSQVAVEAGIAESTLSLVASGKRGMSEQTVTALAAALGVPPHTLLIDKAEGLHADLDRLEAQLAGLKESMSRTARELDRLRKQASPTE